MLLEHGGTDVTQDFIDIGHSRAAYELMREFYIGDVVESEAESNMDKLEGNGGNFKRNYMIWVTAASVAVGAVLFILYIHHNK